MTHTTRGLAALLLTFLLTPAPALALPFVSDMGRAAGDFWNVLTAQRDISNVPLIGDFFRWAGSSDIGNAILRYGLGINVDRQTGAVTTSIADVAINVAAVATVGVAGVALRGGATALRLGGTASRLGRVGRIGGAIDRALERGIKLRATNRLRFLRKPLAKLYKAELTGKNKAKEFRLFSIDKSHRTPLRPNGFPRSHIHSILTDPIVRRIPATTNRVVRFLLPTARHLSVRRAVSYIVAGRAVYRARPSIGRILRDGISRVRAATRSYTRAYRRSGSRRR